MNAKRVRSDQLPAGSWERAVSRIANRANNDTHNGGARALVLAERAQAMKLPHADELYAAVSATYSASTGNPAPDYCAHECSECGCVHFGREAAEACCAEDPAWSEDADDWEDATGRDYPDDDD